MKVLFSNNLFDSPNSFNSDGTSEENYENEMVSNYELPSDVDCFEHTLSRKKRNNNVNKNSNPLCSPLKDCENGKVMHEAASFGVLL